MTTYTELSRERRGTRAGRSSARSARQIADVQVRNRGTIGGNVCANDPTNHLPPLMVALGARMTIVGPDGERTVDAEDFFLGVYMTAVGPGELLTKITIPPGRPRRLRLGHDRARRHVHRLRGRLARRRAAHRDRLRRRRAAPRDRRRGAARRRPRRRGGQGGGARASARRSTRRATSTPRPTTGSTRRGRRRARDRQRRRGAGADGGAIETSRRITVEVNGVAYEREVEARRLLDPLHPRRPRADRQPHRLRHRQLRRLQRPARRRAREELHAARRPGRRREHRRPSRASPDGGRAERRCSRRSATITRSSAATARRGC